MGLVVDGGMWMWVIGTWDVGEDHYCSALDCKHSPPPVHYNHPTRKIPPADPLRDLQQALLGTYLKLHLHQSSPFRRYIVILHGLVGKTFPIVGWTQMLLGAVTALGYCMGGNLGQCLVSSILNDLTIVSKRLKGIVGR